MFRSLMIIGFCCIVSLSHAQQPYSATGRASFYARKFEGRKTASGEIFSNKNLTAAHKTLPFGTVVKVTNTKNNKSVIVRINDRGPYVKGRIIDLTRVAADSLDILHAGWTSVKVEEIIPSVIASNPDQQVLLADPYRLNFPIDWLGNWEGMLKVYTLKGLEKNVPIGLSINPTSAPDRYSWIITYDSIPRSYELLIRDAENNIFSIDEKNGIDITSWLLGNYFVSRFSIEGVLLDCEYHLLNHDEMTFEIRSGNDNRDWTTGNIEMKEDSIPEVSVYRISNLQTATLQRVK